MRNFKLVHFLTIVSIIVVLDHLLKIYIKTNFVLGEEVLIFGEWFRIHFIENPGMAFGWTLGSGKMAKIILTTIRLIIIGGGITYMIKMIPQKKPFWLMVSWSVVIGGSLGNLGDSLFYGLIFDESGTIYNPQLATLFPEAGGYGSLFLGKVVDMLYFPIIRTNIPEWFPFWAGEDFEFFRPVFNLSDSCISIGIVSVIIMTQAQNRKTIVKKKVLSTKSTHEK